MLRLILLKKTSKKFLTNNKRQVMINELLKDFKKRNRKKLLKKSWQSLATLIWYKSCYGSQNKSEKHFRWSRPLKTEQSKTNQMCRASWFNSRQQTFLTSKQYASKQIELNNRKIVLTFIMRVWSWLRTNAGGVPNTCKSNASFLPSACTQLERGVADGWVTRG